jgi:hypothetical protein
MSTLKVDTIQNVAGGSASTPLQLEQGRAKAWVNFNGNAGAVGDSYNVSSVTVNATADFTINFTTAFSNANYSFCTHGRNAVTNTTFETWGIGPNFAQTTSSIRLQNTGADYAGTSNESSISLAATSLGTLCAVFFGDQ